MGVWGEPHPHVGHRNGIAGQPINVQHNINQPKPDPVQPVAAPKPAHVGHHGTSSTHHTTSSHATVHTSTGHRGNHTNHHGPHPHAGHHGPHHSSGHHIKK